MKEHKSELQQKVIALDHALNQARYELSERAVEVCINVLASLQFIRQEHAKSGALLLCFSSYYYYCFFFLGVPGWRSGESTRLPPMWPGFDSQIRRQMWVEFVGSLLCTERFSPGTPISPLLKKPKFEFDLILLIDNLIYSVPN